MDLSSYRTAYFIGNYERTNSIAQDLISSQSAAKNNNLNNYLEFVSIYWKSIIKESGDVSKAAQCIQVLPLPELAKKALIIWSKVYKSHNNVSSVMSPSNSDVMTLQEISSKAYEAVELEVEARDQIILTCAESLLLLSAIPEAFSLLKLVKASNLDCQVMFIEILLKLGQVHMARDRLKKMRNIPEWTDDVRFLLSEASIAFSDSAEEVDDGVEREEEEAGVVFSVKDALYSYQELVQVHGPTTLLLCGLAASFALLGKFTDSQAILAQAARLAPNDANVQANILAISILTNNPSASIKDFKIKFPKHSLSGLLL